MFRFRFKQGQKISYRSLTEPPEIWENSPDCGKLSEPKSSQMIKQLKEDQCLSSCTWKPNPFFKIQPTGPYAHYGIKWYEAYFTDENTFPQLHDSPMVPEDLGCLSSCFEKYKEESDLLTKIQQKCSANGIDRQIPTHLKEGTEMVNTSFESIFTNYFTSVPTTAGVYGFSIPALIFNPNLDCLMYYETNERTECGTGGVCNFIPQNELQNNKHQLVYQNIQNKSSLRFVIQAQTSTYTTLETDYRQKIIRSSSPVTRAIKLCALAKLIQPYRTVQSQRTGSSIFTTSEAHDLFSGDYPTCDKFMPDIFGSVAD